jgi:hypothetical protein
MASPSRIGLVLALAMAGAWSSGCGDTSTSVLPVRDDGGAGSPAVGDGAGADGAATSDVGTPPAAWQATCESQPGARATVLFRVAQRRHVLHVYGAFDTFAPIETQRRYAQAAGFQVAVPLVDPYPI